ncbi:MAG: hypothetical protein AUK26_07135 [Syntrophaceae bacterium CG2_30_58_14]|nr:MAG: hypothetical protein AUK26_07135 [Syntrophaceae bacterium CG2_30_58_14]
MMKNPKNTPAACFILLIFLSPPIWYPPAFSSENAPQIPLNPPLLEGDFIIPLFGKEGLGEIFIVLCVGNRHEGFI